MCRCSESGTLCKYRKTTDKDRLLGRCIHGHRGARYDHILGFTLSPDCPHCKLLKKELAKKEGVGT